MTDCFYRYKAKINETELSMECVALEKDHIVLIDKMPRMVREKGLPGDENSSDIGYCGITGSRNPTCEGLAFAQSILDNNANYRNLRMFEEMTRRLKTTVFIHGHANGIDSIFKRSPSSYYLSIGILPCGLHRVLDVPEIRHPSRIYETDEHGNFSVSKYKQGIFVSQFDYEAPWSVKNAMQRSWTIANLSDVLVAIEPGNCVGGTYATVRMALTAKTPVFVFGKGKGVDDLIERGAMRIDW